MINTTNLMNVSLHLPTQLFYEGHAEKLNAWAENGAFGILANHIDFVTSLVPGVLVLVDTDGQERFFGIDEGVLVKQGYQVDICVRRAVQGSDLNALKTTVRETFIELEDQERIARTALARLEANMVRRFAELREAP